MNNKAQAFIWLTVLVALFGMGLLWLLLNEAYDVIDTEVGGNFTGSPYETTHTKISTIWNMWLAISMIGIIIWGILASMRKRGDYIG